MQQYFKYLSVIFIPLPVTALMVLYSLFFVKTKLTEQDIIHSYAKEIDDYAWVTRVDSVEGFILGSSTLYFGLSPSAISEKSIWINFSHEARDPVVLYQLLKTYYPKKSPRTVVVGLDPWFFSKRSYSLRNEVMYLDLNGEELLRYLELDKMAAFKRSKQILFSELASNPDRDRKLLNFSIPGDYGATPIYNVDSRFNEINKDWFEVKKYGWSDIQFEYLARINRFCLDNKIRVIYLIPPKRLDLVQVFNTKFIAEHNEWWTKICTLLQGAEILGTYDCLKDYDQEMIFAEAYHLNNVGQVAYSKYVRENLSKTKIIQKNYNIFSSVENINP